MKSAKNGVTYRYGDAFTSRRRMRSRNDSLERGAGSTATTCGFMTLISTVHAGGPRGRASVAARPRERCPQPRGQVTFLTSFRNWLQDFAGDCLCCSTRWIAFELAVWMSPWCGPRICGFSFFADVVKILPT